MARDWWKKGRALDLWSIPHFLFGILMGFLPFFIDVSPFVAGLLTVILAVLWEMGEKFVGIKETVLNSIFDIVLPIFAFIITSYVLRVYPLHPDELLVAVGATLILYVFTNVSGWLAYRRRNRDFIH